MLSRTLVFLGLLVPNSLAAPAKQTKLYGTSTSKPKVTFGDDKVFKLLSFSDMHTGENDANDVKTHSVHATVLDQEKPDYVVFNGDLISSDALLSKEKITLLDGVFKPTVDRKIPFSSTYGNHDDTTTINHGDELNYESKNFPLSHTRSDVGPKPWGHVNYWVPVYAKSSDSEPSLLIWFLDSRSFVYSAHAAYPPPEGQSRFVDDKTVPAYIKEQGDLMKKTWKKVPPSLFFVHIPVSVCRAIVNAPDRQFNITNALWELPTNGTHDERPSVQGFIGNSTTHEDTYTGRDYATWNAIAALSNTTSRVLAITHGHDHGDNWCGRSKVSSGIPVCYQGHSGYGGYVTTNSHVRNGRVFTIALDEVHKAFPTVHTWNSCEQGDRLYLTDTENTDEDKTIAQKVVLDRHFMSKYN